MDSDERQIFEYLKSWPSQYISGREVARRADGKRRFREDPQWAFPVLTRMVEQGFIESDGLGHYRSVHVQAAKESKKNKKWVSPQLQRVLERSGKDFTHILDAPEEEETKDPEK